MGGKLNVFGLGSLGVNVDKNPINLEDGELSKAQNGIHDPAGSMGGVRKRRGLTKINSVAAAGAVKGAIGVPISAGTAGNPIPAVDPDTRTILVGRRISAATTGWNVTTDAFATALTTGGPDGFDANATPTQPDTVFEMYAGETADIIARLSAHDGRPSVVYKNKLYYAGNNYTPGTTDPTIRMYDGSVDYQIAKVLMRGSTRRRAILCMCVGGDDMIYLTTYDSGNSGASTQLVTVFQLNPESGTLAQMGSLFPITSLNIPYALAWGQGRLWTRTFNNQSGDANYRTYFIRPGIDNDWTLDNTTATARGCTDLISFQGQMYFSMLSNAAAGAIVEVRSPIGVFTTSKTALLTEAAGAVMGAFGTFNSFSTMCEFNGALYVSYYNRQDGANFYARIYKFDGTTWTVVYGPVVNHATAVSYARAMVIDGILYFFSVGSTTGTNVIISSPDGTTWTDRSSVLTGGMAPVVGVIAS